MKRTITIFLLLSFFMSNAQISQRDNVGKIESIRWKKDLLKLYEKLEDRHVDLYHTVSKDSLDNAVNRLYEDIPQLSREQILVRISQVVAMIGDGHTSFFPGLQRRKKFHLYPMKFWAFSEGIYVTSAQEKYKEYVGKKLVRIENTEISEVFEKVSTTIGVDNKMEYTYSVPYMIYYAELLHVLGITKSDKKAEFHFENGSATLYSMSIKEWLYEDYVCANNIYPNGKSPSQRIEALFATPLTIDSLRFDGRRKYYWFKHLEEKNAIFLQYNVCWDQKDRPVFASMISDMFKKLESCNAQRLIIDLRQNSGGEPLIAQPLIEELQKRKKYVDEGRVFVLVGRRTFSAALTNSVQLRKIGARTVGEPSRGKPNNPSEGRDIKLFLTGIWATVSTQFVERDPDLGDSDFIPIDIICKMSFDDFQNGIDAALNKALSAELYIEKE